MQRARQSALSPAAAPLLEAGTAADAPETRNVRQLRFHGRIEIDIHAHVLIDGSRRPVELRNISRSGAGIRGSAGLSPSDNLIIELPDGRALAALVRWSRLGFFGVEFREPLAKGDPLLETGVVTANAGRDPGHRASVVTFPPGNREVSEGTHSRWMNLAVRWRQLIGGASAAPKLSPSMMKRACRKQGFSWLVDE